MDVAHRRRSAVARLMLDWRGAHESESHSGRTKVTTHTFVEAPPEREVPPRVAQDTNRRRSAIDGRTTRHDGHRLSQRVRKRVVEVFGWTKTVGDRRIACLDSARASAAPSHPFVLYFA